MSILDDFIEEKKKRPHRSTIVFLQDSKILEHPLFDDKLEIKKHNKYSKADRKSFEKDGRNKKYYFYIPMYNERIAERILDCLYKAHELGLEIKYFIDVGCGPGFSLEVAELFGLKPFGIEISKLTANVALEKYPDSIFVGDAFDFDFTQLENTLIYTYMPIEDSSLMTELGNKISSEIRKENIWTEMYPAYHCPVMINFTNTIFKTDKEMHRAQLY